MPICCGIFCRGNYTELHATSAFSHLLKVIVAPRNKFEIYPRKGEVWGIYRNISSEWSSSNLQTCEYDIGEVLKVNDNYKILVLEKVSDYKKVFKAQKKAGRESILEIPRPELLRFSHQIPAFQLTDEKEGTLHGCWELDPYGIPVRVDEEIPSSPFPLKFFEKQETIFCNFDNERSCDKFKTGQIWALYCKLDEFPKNYAQIENVESYPRFKLVVKWLNLCNPPKGVIPWVDKGMPVCCGTFKVASGEGVVFNDSIFFSYQLSGVEAGNHLYTIYPRVGEVWALHSKFCSDLTCSNLKNCEYCMVEGLEVVDCHWIIVSILRSVTGFKTVFNTKKIEGLDSIAGAIPWIELYRFSHQVPAFRLTEARYGKLCGCWELDPRSTPVCLYSTN
ncbi:hypothetical protein MKX01_034124 [Papaver californicum]|nr:hypothetical protein MKX01_034124 [Papaver californicum]